MLKSDKILLRPLQLSDLDFLFEIENNKENWKYGTENKQYTKEELTNYIANAKQDIATAGQFRFVIDFENTPIGFIDLFDYDAHNKRAGVSIVLIEMYRQKGYGKDALNLLVKYSFDKLFIHQLYCNVLEDNFASICLFESVGFTKVGIKKEWRYYKGVFKNEYLFQLINYVL
jgi:diamine N-acetyltransferase